MRRVVTIMKLSMSFGFISGFGICQMVVTFLYTTICHVFYTFMRLKFDTFDTPTRGKDEIGVSVLCMTGCLNITGESHRFNGESHCNRSKSGHRHVN